MMDLEGMLDVGRFVAISKPASHTMWLDISSQEGNESTVYTKKVIGIHVRKRRSWEFEEWREKAHIRWKR